MSTVNLQELSTKRHCKSILLDGDWKGSRWDKRVSVRQNQWWISRDTMPFLASRDNPGSGSCTVWYLPNTQVVAPPD